MKKLGTVPIPNLRYQRDGNRAQMARQMLTELTPDKADLYEFSDKEEAKNFRSMLATMAVLKGIKVHMKVLENTLYLWLAVPELPLSSSQTDSERKEG